LVKIKKFLGLTIFLVFFVSGLAIAQDQQQTLFQISTINALLEGVYDGPLTIKELKKHGDFGIGTFNALDGEMIGFNGKFFQFKSDGKAYPVNDAQKTPFASVTFFKPEKTVTLEKQLDFKQLEIFLDNLLPTKNILYAIKIDGVFSYVKTRIVPRQHPPYPRLAEVAKTQPIFEFNQIKGTIVGFRLPDYMKGLNVTGYHLHFLTSDQQAGGHLLECKIEQGTAALDQMTDFYLSLPQQQDFYQKDISQDKEQELKGVER
jgi:acetolactate decarboxylase